MPGIYGADLRKCAPKQSSQRCLRSTDVLQWTKCRRQTSGRASVAARVSGVSVTVEKSTRNTRNLYACTYIGAPLKVVWASLTGYEQLQTFIPGLTENRCLHKHATGARLLQVGEQDVALGARFRARVVLDCQEYQAGLPPQMHLSKSDGTIYPVPKAPVMTAGSDITFTMVEGDFQVFQGVWRMQPEPASPSGTWLSYALHVRPPIWMPVRLIQGRIEGEVAANLAAVRDYSVAQWAVQQPRGPAAASDLL